MQTLLRSLLLFCLVAVFPAANAKTYPLDGNTSMVGKVFTVTPQKNDTFSRYARIYDVAPYALQLANPGIDENYPDKQHRDITVPAAFLLPSKRDGIVINLPELRLYYFTQGQVTTFPVSIGRAGWKTPVAETKVVEKIKDPVWVVPDSILAEADAKGTYLPDVVPAGPNNPLGQYELRLGLPGYLIHGTNAPRTIGRFVSHGCIRLFPSDIEELFGSVSVGTPVALVNEPIKAAWEGNQLYLQVFPVPSQYAMSESERQSLLKTVLDEATNGKSIQINWKLVEKMMEQASGIPAVIS